MSRHYVKQILRLSHGFLDSSLPCLWLFVSAAHEAVSGEVGLRERKGEQTTSLFEGKPFKPLGTSTIPKGFLYLPKICRKRA